MKLQGKDVKLERGVKMKRGKGWRLVTPKGGNRGFKASLLRTFSSKGERFAIFRVLGYPEGEQRGPASAGAGTSSVTAISPLGTGS